MFGRRAFDADRAAGEAPTATAEEVLSARIEALRSATTLELKRMSSGIARVVDVRPFLAELRPLDAAAHAEIARAGLVGDLVGAVADVLMPGSGGIRPAEIAALLSGALERATADRPEEVEAVPHQAVRLALLTDVQPAPLVHTDQTPQPAWPSQSGCSEYMPLP